jgi:hypothetical protein
MYKKLEKLHGVRLDLAPGLDDTLLSGVFSLTLFATIIEK